jgi:hypothetical protein
MKEPVREVSLVPEDLLSGAAFLLTTALMLVWGVFPRALLEVARGAAAAFTGR